METKLLIKSSELLKQVNLPVLFKNKILLAPGDWNDNQYTAKEIEKAYLNTNWKNKSNFSLYLDHLDTQKQGVSNWVGYVKNIKLTNKSLVGDLEVWNPTLIIYLNQAKAKFGVSATLKGFENPDNEKMQDFKFESFSVVTNPACKDSYINLSQKNNERRLKIITMAEEKETEQPVDEPEEKEEASETTEDTETEEENTESESLAKKKEKYPEPYKEKKQAKKKKPEDEEEEMKKKKKPEDEEELSQEELTQLYLEMDEKELSKYTQFVKDYLKKHKGARIAEAAKAWKSSKKLSEELEELNDLELLEQISERYMILRRRKKYPEKEETQEEKIDKLSEEVKQLNQKLMEPDRKTLNIASPTEGLVTSDPLAGMAEFLQAGGQGVFGISK